jgi:starch phosphorylase
MANLAIVGSHSVNGVAQLHTDILKSSTFAEMNDLFPDRFNNKTNGITPRRWLLKCNPGLARLVAEALGDDWVRDLDQLRGLEEFAQDAGFQEDWDRIKKGNKASLAEWLRTNHEIELDPSFLFDVQVKRIHEYKRQLLNLLHVVTLFNRLRDGVDSGVPRAVLIGGKAAPAYWVAKRIIHLASVLGDLIAKDPATKGKLSLHFLPNYRVSLAERVFPAAELSEQISTAGTEASGTGNMKASLNGAITIGTLDGANIEIREEVGSEHFFTFGHTAEGIASLRSRGYLPRTWIEGNPELKQAVETIASLEDGCFRSLTDILWDSDHYLHAADYASYVEAQERVSALYARPDEWARWSIRNVAGMGKFSIDRTVREYSREIWKAQPVPIPLP